MQISTLELHNYLISESSIYQIKEAIDESTGEPLISDTALSELMTENVRKMTYRYKHMCGCKICFIICSIQASLHCYRLEHLNLLREQARAKGGRIARSGVDATETANSYYNDVYPNNQNMHLNPRDAQLAIQCKPVGRFSVPHFQCVLQ